MEPGLKVQCPLFSGCETKIIFMRKALTLRAIPAALSIAILPAGAITAQDNGQGSAPPATQSSEPAPPPMAEQAPTKQSPADSAPAGDAAPQTAATMDGSDVVLTDARGGKANVVVTDVKASNGVVHAIDAVVMP